MPKRVKMARGQSRRDFKKKAARVHPKNMKAGGSYAMRGGIRL